MKSTNNNIHILLFILIASIYNFFIQNGLEKIFCQTYFNNEYIRRPLNDCLYSKNSISTSCIGMPSGHAETITIFTGLLYLYKYIPLWLCLLLIFIFSIQRIIFSMHTFFQVIAGIFTGLLYVFIYKNMNFSIYSFIIVFSIGLILAILCIYKLDNQIYGPIPKWVDPIMMQSISKKQNSPLYIKIGSIYANSIVQTTTFISWKQLEQYLDIIIDRIRNSGEHFDAVVGIKTGGAIISDYISNRLGLPNYKIKLSKSIFNCDKKSINALQDIGLNMLYTNQEFIICEGIDNKLVGKNIILIDESVASGITINEAYKYLKEHKKVNYIYPTTISFNKHLYNFELDIPHTLNDSVIIWPWGYDN